MTRVQTTQDKTDKKAYMAIGVVSTLVFAFLIWLIYFNTGSETKADWVLYLPDTNAFLNFTTTCLLIMGVYFIKQGKREAHIKTMLTATATSALFLVGYIVYHHFHGDTKFVGQGIVRPIYFFILISHIVLSVVNVPMIFATLYQAFRKNHEKHKKLARWTFPVWLYVSFTGVLIYFFLKFLNA